MSNVFLKAAWRNLIMANYAVDPELLKPYLPCGTELDTYNGNHYISLVGFLFEKTRIKGIRVPFHHTFEEVNLRFYVRYKQDDGPWRRGVVFIKEIVPKHMITWVANRLYGENYSTQPMRHQWRVHGDNLHITYEWKIGSHWDSIKVIATEKAAPLIQGSEEAFITEHYWGYTTIHATCTGTYEVVHPPWMIHKVLQHDIQCQGDQIYGKAIGEILKQKPASVFLAAGSAIEVRKGEKLHF